MKKAILYISLIGNILLIVLLVRSALFFNENMENTIFQGDFVGKNTNSEYELNQLGTSPRLIRDVSFNKEKTTEELVLLEDVPIPQLETPETVTEVKEVEAGEENAIEPSQEVVEAPAAPLPSIAEDLRLAAEARALVAQRVQENQAKIETKPVGELIITKVNSTYRSNLLSLMIDANNPIDARAYVLENPSRLVVDVKGTWELPEIPTLASNGFARALRTGYQPGITRFVIDMRKNNFTYDLQKRSKSLQLYIFFNSAN